MNEEIEKQIGWNISKLRMDAKISQNKMSAKMQLEGVDITRSALAKIEVGQRHLYVDEIIAIKKILNCSFDKIFEIKIKKDKS